MNHDMNPRESIIYQYTHPRCGDSKLKFLKLQKEKDIVSFHCHECSEDFPTHFKGGHLLSAEEKLRLVYP